MRQDVIRIATRKSALAMWQAESVKAVLEQHYPDLKVELLGMLTEGDRQLATPLSEIGGKGLFMKELEKAVLERRADIAVHSVKDLTMDFPDGLALTAVCERDDPRDVFVSSVAPSLAALPKGATIGTSSLRRGCQLMAARPDCVVKPLRGNVLTRVQKCREGDVDAIVLAYAGLIRLKRETEITAIFSIDEMLPAVGQGAIGIESRTEDVEMTRRLRVLNHAPTRDCVSAERAVTRSLGGSCTMPIAAYATVSDDDLHLIALVGSPDGREVIRVEQTGLREEGDELGEQCAQTLLDRGAGNILASC